MTRHRLAECFLLCMLASLAGIAAPRVPRPAAPPTLAQVQTQCEQAIQTAPDSDHAAAAVGRYAGRLLEDKRALQAMGWLQGLVAQYPRVAAGRSACYWLGVAAEQRGETAAAEQAYTELITVAPDSLPAANAVSRLAQLLARTSPDRVTATLGDLAQRHSGTQAGWQARYEQAGLLLAAGEVLAADEAFGALLAGTAPEQVKAQARVARSLVSYRLIALVTEAYRAKEYDTALRHLDRMLADPGIRIEWAWALLVTGQAHQELKHYDQAVAAYQRLVKEFPQTSEAPSGQFLLGECLRLQGKWDEAVVAQREFVSRWPKHALADHARQRIRSCREAKAAAALAAAGAE